MNTQNKQRIHYIPLGQAMPGMVLGAPLVLTEHGIIRFNLPTGHVLNDSLLEQLRTRHAEIVCVVEPDERSPEQRELDNAREVARLNQVFQLADREQPLIRNLYRAVLAYRSA